MGHLPIAAQHNHFYLNQKLRKFLTPHSILMVDSHSHKVKGFGSTPKSAIMNKKVEFRNYKCKSCNKEFPLKRGKNQNFLNRKICDNCLKSKIGKKTKEEIFSRRKNWQSARTEFRKFAEKEMAKNDLPKKCFICNYNKTAIICHKKAVKDFSDTALLEEISGINNLVYLCPNHHWELDNGLLSL